MITYKEIGHFGRLGNQLFQFASTYGIANFKLEFVQEAYKQRANDTEFLPEKFKKGFVFDKNEV